MSDHLTESVAYSYIRFSTPEQAKGDSLRRQTELAENYCKRKGWKLDTTLTLRDLGVSAFRGDNALVGNLGEFLKAVKRGTVLPGSVLIVESIDRISRQGIDEGYDLIKGILKAGIHLVTLSPEREFDVEATKSLSKGALEIQLILERAAEESERKSERIGAAWRQKQAKARNGIVMSKQLPAWVRKTGGKLELIPEATKAVRQVFKLAASGYGLQSIIKKLTESKVPPIGRASHWARSTIAALLRDRRVIGEYQPCKGRIKDGEPIPDYYPRVIEDDEWYRARAGAKQRQRHKGRFGTVRTNLFAGILKHGLDGDSFIMTQRQSQTPGKPIRQYSALINGAGHESRAKAVSLPYDGFESRILSKLREIDPHEILNGDHGPDETIALAGELAAIEAKIGEVEAIQQKTPSAANGRVLATLEDQQRDKAAELAEARQRAAHPISESWGECHSLIDALNKAPDQQDARLRLRAALRRIVDSIWMIVVPHRLDRLAYVQIWFAGRKKCRTYYVFYRPASRNRKSAWYVNSWKQGPEDGIDMTGVVGLQDPKNAAKIERSIRKWPESEWELYAIAASNQSAAAVKE